MKLAPVVVTADVAASQNFAFKFVVPISLPTIFTGYGLLPAVVGTKNQTGAWDAAGQTRTVLLSDGSSAQKFLTSYDYPQSFSYTVRDFTGPLRFLAVSAEGEWQFIPDAPKKTHIRWRCTFDARSVFAAPLLWVIATIFWRGYMRQVLSRSVGQIQTSTAKSNSEINFCE